MGEAPSVFKQVVEFYLAPGSWIVDLTYGEGKLWGAFSNPSLQYRLFANDVDPESPCAYHVPFDKIGDAWPYKTVKAQGAIYDPPYLYGRSSHYLLTPKEKDLDWQPRKTKWTVEAQIEAARTLNEQIPKFLAPDGVVIVKIMNSRFKKKLIKSTQIIEDAFSNFEEIAEFIYVRTNVGFYRSSRTPQTAHGFYLVFKVRRSK